MQARDIMNKDVVVINPETPVWKVSSLFLDKQIRGAPIVADGAPVGMVSDGDLIRRDDDRRRIRWDWWLTLLVQDEAVDVQVLREAAQRRALDVMSAPVLTVEEDAELADLVALMLTHRIKRIPVVHDGVLVGIVCRAELMRAVVSVAQRSPRPSEPNLLRSALETVDEQFMKSLGSNPVQRRQTQVAAREDEASAEEFRRLVVNFERKEAEEKQSMRDAIAARRRGRVTEMVERHVSDATWRELIHRAQEAAEHGEKEFLLLRFPSQLCSDGSRAINAAEEGWPSTLRGEAAEIYLRWERDLKPKGFHLLAQVLDFPDGLPGDVGLILAWGEPG